MSLSDHVLVTKHLSQNDVMVKVLDPGRDADCTSALRTEYSHIAAVVDLQCDGSALFLAQVSGNVAPLSGRRPKSVALSVSQCTRTHAHTACDVTRTVQSVRPRTGHEDPEEELKYSSTLS